MMAIKLNIQRVLVLLTLPFFGLFLYFFVYPGVNYGSQIEPFEKGEAPRPVEIPDKGIELPQKSTPVTDTIPEDTSSKATIALDALPAETKKEGVVDFAELRSRWSSTLTGSDAGVDLSGDEDIPWVSPVIKRLTEHSEGLLNELELGENQTWPDLSPITAGDHFRISFERLLVITLAYCTERTKQHKKPHVLDQILRSLDVISRTAFNATTKAPANENWWNYRIGAPLKLMDISMLLYDHIGPERRRSYADVVLEMSGNLHDNSLTGANRADVCQTVVAAGILIEDEYTLGVGRDCFLDRFRGGKNSVFAVTNSGDGFRQDGSYIAHSMYSYAGGYGVEHMVAVAKAARVLQGTPYSFPASGISNLLEAVSKTFTPVMFHGMLMAPVRGRNIARMTKPDTYWGNLLMRAVLNLADIAPEPYVGQFQSLCRGWAEQTSWPEMGGTNLSQAMKIWRIIENEIAPAKPLRGTYVFPVTDRVVYHQGSWVAALAMSSRRVGRYEALNSENLRPWYQGDGMLYLYTDNDPLHYSNDYWPTMDPYHTPGVTSGLNIQEPPVYNTRGWKPWAGGAKWAHPANGADYGAASLDHLAKDKLSSARKSWYFTRGGIIALGAICAGFNGTEVHTTIESRNLPVPGAKLTVDGEVHEGTSNSTFEKPAARWAHIENLGGYMFLDGEGAMFTRESRAGRWSDVNNYTDYAMYNATVTREYLTIARNHGVDPTKGSYAYAIIPGASAEATGALSANPDFVVLASTWKLQAVSLNGNRTYMATFWKPGKIGSLSANSSCTVIWGYESDDDDTFTLSISEPSQLSRKLEVSVDATEIASVLHHDETITVAWGKNKLDPVQVVVDPDADTTKLKGRTHSVFFKRR